MPSRPDPARTGSLQGVRAAVLNWRDPWHSLAGGSERYAWEFATALRDAGADVEFLTARDVHQTARDRRDDIPVRRGGSRYTFYPWAWWQLVSQRLRGRAYAVVVDAENGIPVFSPPLVGRRALVLLVVHHVHQEQFLTYFRPAMASFGRWLERWLMPRVYRRVPTIVVSESTRQEMADQLGWSPEVRIVHNGADTAAHVAVRPEPHRVVLLGRLATHKRVDLVLRAVELVRTTHPDLRVDVVGKGPEGQRLRALVTELGLDEVVRLHGFLDEDEKHEVLGRASLHVCASDTEGWGQVVVEAASYGLPTLARDVPGLRDSIRDGETGWLVDTEGLGPDGIVRALADGLRQAFEHLERDTDGVLAERCRAWSARFSWKHMHEQVVGLVAGELAHRRPSGRGTDSSPSRSL